MMHRPTDLTQRAAARRRFAFQVEIIPTHPTSLLSSINTAVCVHGENWIQSAMNAFRGSMRTWMVSHHS